MHWHGVNDDPDGEDILPYIKEPDRPAKLPHVNWATPKIVKDVQYLANKYRTKEEQEWMHPAILRGWEHGCFRKMKSLEGEQQHRSGRGRGGRGRARGGARSRKKRRTDAEEPFENEEVSSSSQSSDDNESLVPLQNQPHSAARVRVRRTLAMVFALSDEEREAQDLREEGCRSDLSDFSSEAWLTLWGIRLIDVQVMFRDN
eukprot:g9062.t1